MYFTIDKKGEGTNIKAIKGKAILKEEATLLPKMIWGELDEENQ